MTIECSQSVHSIVADPSITTQTFDDGKYTVYPIYGQSWR